MPIIVTALVALGLKAAAIVTRRARKKPGDDAAAVATAPQSPVGARRTRLPPRRTAA